MTGPLYRLGGFCSRHHWPVIGVWVIVALALAIAGRAVGEQTSDNLSLPGTDSTQALDTLQSTLPQQANGVNQFIFEAKTGKLTDSGKKQAVENVVEDLKKDHHVVAAVSPFEAAGKNNLSKDATIGYIAVTLDEGASELDEEEAQSLVDRALEAETAELDAAVGGYVGQAVSKPSTHVSEAIGLTAAVVILLFAFGTATAMFLPIATAVLGLVSTLAIIKLLGHAVAVPSISPTLATMIGLGVGIDYALFIVTRHKLQLGDGMEMRESIARATATAGGAVVFAGGTVVIALISLLVAGIPLVTTLGYTAAIAVVVAVLAAITLLPALLGALGPRIDSLRVHLGKTHPDDHEPHGWRRWALRVTRRPGLATIVSVSLLLVLSLPVLNLELGQNDIGAESESTQSRQAYDLITKGFGAGQNGPLLIAVTLGKPAAPDQQKLDDFNDQQKQQQQQAQQQAAETGQPPPQPSAAEQQQQADQKKALESPSTDPRLTKLTGAVGKAQGIKSVSPVVLDKAGTTGAFTAVPTSAPSDDATETTVRELRDTTIPDATKGTDVNADVGGQTAAYIDLADQIGEKLPLMILVVVGLSFFVLMLAFRSLVVPAKAAAMNLLSVGAAYGVVTFVFQEGHGATLIGLDGPVPIVSFVPLLMFAILFGLSMDYEVFLLTQMQEHFKEDDDPTKAVVDGLATTGRVITSAALIMVCVFSSFIANGDPVVKQFGVGLAVAIAIDATVVRCLLVPAIMTLLGRSSWWLPRRLDRLLPKISIEGDAYFAEMDARRRSGPA